MSAPRQTVKELQAAARAAVVAGGPPSRQTPADKRLKENQPDKAPPVKPSPPKGPKAKLPPASPPTLPAHAVENPAAVRVDRFRGRRLYAAARMARWQTQLDGAARKALAARRARCVAAVKAPAAVTADAMAADAFEADTWGQTVDATILPVAQGIMAEIVAGTASMVDGTAVGNLPDMAVAARSQQMVDWYTKLGADTATRLQATLTEGANLGESIPDLLSRVQDVFDASDTRAELIARTELSSAANGLQMDMARQVEATGMVLQKSWLAGNCDECQGNEDDGAIGLDESFTSGDDSPPAHPGCVCAIAVEPVDDEVPVDDGSVDDGSVDDAA